MSFGHILSSNGLKLTSICVTFTDQGECVCCIINTHCASVIWALEETFSLKEAEQATEFFFFFMTNVYNDDYDTEEEIMFLHHAHNLSWRPGSTGREHRVTFCSCITPCAPQWWNNSADGGGLVFVCVKSSCDHSNICDANKQWARFIFLTGLQPQLSDWQVGFCPHGWWLTTNAISSPCWEKHSDLLFEVKGEIPHCKKTLHSKCYLMQQNGYTIVFGYYLL